MDRQSLIRLKNLDVDFGRKPILRCLNADLPPGPIGLLGPNGAGKSTLMKTLMGFIKPQNGSAEVFGLDCRSQGAEIRQRIGYMPEDDTYIPGMSAVGFVAYCGQLCGLPRREAILRAHQTLHYCGLGEARYRPVDEYSTGMLQRIKLAQALVHDPQLLLLDEPTNGLDPPGRQDLLELIQDISRRQGISVILSSHLLPDVEMVCSHVVVLFEGRIAQSGNIEELKRMAKASYEVRIKGDPQRFDAALRHYGGWCEPKRDGLTSGSQAAASKQGVLRVIMPDGKPAAEIFAAASDSDTQIRHLTEEEMTLQEVFSNAIDSVRQTQLPRQSA